MIVLQDELKVQNNSSEGLHQITNMIAVKFSWFRYISMWILIICTGFLFGLVLKWFPKLYNAFIYENSNHKNATHFIVFSLDHTQTVCEKGIKVIDSIVYTSFVFRQLTYIFIDGQYRVLQLNLEELTNYQIIWMEGIIEEVTLKEKQQVYGKCLIEIPQLQLHVFLFDVLTAPFQLLLYVSLVILFGEALIDYAIAIMVASTLAIFSQFYFLRRSLRELQVLAFQKFQVSVQRSQNQSVDNIELTPGDLLILRANSNVPCDCILIKGEVMVNEASLTGESIPVPKIPIQENGDKFKFQNINTLYEGTKIVKCTGNCVALVARTGFTTLKGQYFRNVLYPKKYNNPFYKNSMKFILGITLLMHIIFFANLYQGLELGYTNEVIIIRYLFIVTWIFPPQIPIIIQIKGAIALVKLKTMQIIGRNIDKIQIAGKTNIICFDKTGTLTNLGMEVKGYWQEDPQNLSNKLRMYQIMATCHHLTQIEGEISGDLLEVEMFKFCGWIVKFDCQDCKFEVTSSQDQHFRILQIFDFDSAISMMSVVVQDVKSKKYYLFAKGSPEKIQQKSKHISNLQTLEENLTELTIQGYRVISLAYREIIDPNLSRGELEDDLTFVAYLYFENKLKNDTPSVIKSLNEASLSLKVISGDNILTTIHCAKQCGIIKELLQEVIILDSIGSHNFKVERLAKNQIQQQSYQWEDLYNVCMDILNEKNVELAITGNFLTLLNNTQTKLDYIKSGRSSRSEAETPLPITITTSSTFDLPNRIILKTKVFARMKPEQKSTIVKNIQDQGNVVAMIGDGANDCSAISQADVGVSFCTSDASYTAHFAYQNTSIDCLITILAVGRQTTITISLLFQYLVAAFCIINAGRQILAIEDEGFGDLQTIYLVFFQQLPILLIASQGKPILKLANKIPMDNQSLIPVQVAFYYQIIIVMLTQLFLAIFIIHNPKHKYTQTSPPITEYIYQGPLESALFPVVLIGSTTFIFNMFVTYPFQERIYRNWMVAIWCLVHWLYGFILIFVPKAGIWLSMIPINSEIPNLQWTVFWFVIVSNALMIIGATIFDRYIPRTHLIKNGVVS